MGKGDPIPLISRDQNKLKIIFLQKIYKTIKPIERSKQRSVQLVWTFIALKEN